MSRKRIYRCSMIFMGWTKTRKALASAYVKGDKMTIHSIKRIDYCDEGRPWRVETDEAIFVMVRDS